MKEKEIRLTSQEIDYLLKGTIQWDDILSRQQSSLRKPLDVSKKVQEDKWKSWKPEELEELKGGDFRRKDSSSRDFSKDFFSRKDYQEDYHKGNCSPKDSQEGDNRPQEDEEENDIPPLSGTKVYVLLSLMACIVFGTWIYFVFA